MAKSSHKIDIMRESREGGVVAHVVYDNARRLNVVGPQSLDDLAATFRDLAKEPDLRVVVFSGAGGKAFIGGADIYYMADMKTAEDARGFITRIHLLCQAIRECPVPVICRMEGYTLGGGLEVAAACDFRIAADSAAFGMPEVNVGIPSVVEAALLPRLIGWGRTSWLLLTGQNIGAQKALEWGLVETVVKPRDLGDAIERDVAAIVAAAPKAVRAQKSLMRRWEGLPLDDAIRAGIDCFAQSATTGEHTERMQAFVNRKRK